MQKFEITIDPKLGCEACAVNFLNIAEPTKYGRGCTKHAAQSIDPVIAAVVAYEKRRDVYQQLAYVEFVKRGSADPGFSREWATEFASRDVNAAFGRAINELDAAGVIDMEATRSDPEEAARVVMNIIDMLVQPMTDRTLDQDGNIVTDPAFAAELRINRRAEGRDLRTGKFPETAAVAA